MNGRSHIPVALTTAPATDVAASLVTRNRSDVASTAKTRTGRRTGKR